MLEIVLTSPESDQYSSALKEISKFPLMYMTGYFCRSVYFTNVEILDSHLHFCFTKRLKCPAIDRSPLIYIFRYTKEWLSSMVAAGIIHQDKQTNLYTLPEGHKQVLRLRSSFATGVGVWATRAELTKKCFQKSGPWGKQNCFKNIIQRELFKRNSKHKNETLN